MKDKHIFTDVKRPACSRSAVSTGSATFGGKHADQYEAMKRALADAAAWHGSTGEYAIYDYLQDVPKTSLVIELVDALHRSGFRITRSQNGRISSQHQPEDSQ